eukprot:CAMPEP_0172833526 /NCGR_PEP_ID=MMETSP1075-20121228/24421_1 /TAXON_ID=2916 /ORGANISM="Ceratium fusus, Strain PA161109" /LENGTH=151 /DNA_ID=CAMNT_0013676285 /DNA_START=334 /DNA_END=786 /DNA_ORIENTATION=-
MTKAELSDNFTESTPSSKATSSRQSSSAASNVSARQLRILSACAWNCDSSKLEAPVPTSPRPVRVAKPCVILNAALPCKAPTALEDNKLKLSNIAGSSMARPFVGTDWLKTFRQKPSRNLTARMRGVAVTALRRETVARNANLSQSVPTKG